MQYDLLISGFILLSSAVLLIFCSYILYIYFDRRIHVNAFTFFYAKFVMFIYVGSMLFNIYNDPQRMGEGVYDDVGILLNTWIYSIVFLLLFSILYIVFTSYFSNFKYTKNLTNLKVSRVELGRGIDLGRVVICVASIAFISTLAAVDYIGQLNELPIFHVFSDLSTVQLALLRSESGYGFSGKYWLYMFFIKTIPLYLYGLIFFIRYRNRVCAIIYVYLLLFNIFFSVMDLQKGPLIEFILYNLMLLSMENFALIKKYFIFILIGCFLPLILMYYLFMNLSGVDAMELLLTPLNRLVLGQVEPLIWYQKYLQSHSLLAGASLPNPGGVLPFEHVKVVTIIWAYAHPELEAQGIIGSMPTIFYGDFLINFGWPAVVISILIFAFILSILDVYFIRKLNSQNGVIRASLYAYLILFFGKYVQTTIMGIVTDVDLWGILIIAGIVHLYSNRRHLRMSNYSAIQTEDQTYKR